VRKIPAPKISSSLSASFEHAGLLFLVHAVVAARYKLLWHQEALEPTTA
jgi:hypothetical protein